jgi:uncharacterized protein (DUF1330 family)
MAQIHTGGCHCGRVRFRVTGAISGATECNCSICRKKGFLHWIVARDRFELVAGQDDVATYQFNTGVARHMFCRECGIHAFYVPRSDPDKIDVNLRCLDDVDLTTLAIAPFDGRHWEAAMEGGDVPWRAAAEAPGFVLVAILGVRPAALAEFRAYEHTATRIMRRHGGAIARTIAVAPVPGEDLVKEIHVVTFANDEGFAAYLRDPELLAAAPQRDAAIATTQILRGRDGPTYG